MTIETFNVICYVWLGVAVVTHVVLFFVTSPFGRHTRASWGPQIDTRPAWVIMELPSLAVMCGFLVTGTHSTSTWAWVLFSCWIVHYANRTLIYPLRIRPAARKMPIVIVANGVLFNLMNAGLNGYFLAELCDPQLYGDGWLTRPTTWIGAALFVGGLWINLRCDHLLINLRGPGEAGYKIPRGSLFELVSAPNLLGEIIEWVGFAIMAWNLPALTFAVWTYANLVPRAKNHHDWYHRNFDDYPKSRKALFPFVY